MQGEACLSMEEIAAMGEAIAETAAILDVATHRFLTQLREFDRVDGWHRAGALSCAHWLSWRVGMDLGAAREKVRVAKRLGELPRIDEALRKGESETSLENTALVCRRHHRLLHEHGFSLERTQGELVFRDPRGQVVAAQGPRQELTVDLAELAARWRGAPVTAEVNPPGWDGQPVDYDLCLAALA